jgi:U3 small nucleolar RNA-associated protein 10
MAAVRQAAFLALHAMLKRVGDPLLIILPEMMPYVSEALEDDDVDVELAVRNLIALLQEISGEDIQDYLS